MVYSGPQVATPLSGDASVWEYGYQPSLAMGVIGVVLFLLLAIPHLYWFVTKRGTRSVNALFFFGCLIEALGYGARLTSHNFPFNGLSFLIGIFLIQIGTIFVTAPLYKAVQRAIKYTPGGRVLSPMRPRSMLTCFLILDVVMVILQIAGQYFYGAAESASVTAATPMFALGTSTLIFLAGNVIQGITIIIVTIFVIVIYRRSLKLLANADPNLQYPLLKPVILQVIASFVLFFIRLLVRIAEGAQGAYGFAATHEVFFGVFEFLVSPVLPSVSFKPKAMQPIFLIYVIWAVRPLYLYIFPLGHHHGEGAHTRNDASIGHLDPATHEVVDPSHHELNEKADSKV
ncbi:hypothetical protein P7C73_g4531, partial [Tremellales sp. Uapishka_1]